TRPHGGCGIWSNEQQFAPLNVVGLGELDLHSQPAGQHSRPSGTIVSEIGNAAGSEPHSSGCIKSGNINMSREHADLVAGAVAGAANVLSGYPLDTVKVRMQSSSPGAPHGAMACLRHILRHEGVPGLFRGVTTPLVGGALESGVNYMALAPSTSSDSGQRGGSSDVLGGSGSSSSSSSSGSSPKGPSCASPLPGGPPPPPLPPQLVHCRMQSAEYRRLGGPGALLRDLLAAEGLRGLGRGLGATVIREVPGNALFFVMWAVVLPLDVAKTRLQVAVPGSAWDVGVAQHLRMIHGGRRRSLGSHSIYGRSMYRVEILCTLHAPLRKSCGLIADCDGYAVVCCVEEEGVGWVVKRSKTGAGFTTLFSLDFQPMGFAVNGTSFWICSYDRSIMEYSAAGVCLQRIAGPAGAYMEFLGNTLFTVAYNNKCDPDLCCMDKMGRTVKLLVNHVKPSGSFALFPAAQKLLFISSRNNLCQLDLPSGECRVVTPSVWPEGGRLLTGNDQLALLIVPCTGGSNFFSCSMQGELHHLLSMSHSAVNGGFFLNLNRDFRLNSRGDLLFIDQPDKALPRICCLPALLPPPEASASKILIPKGPSLLFACSLNYMPSGCAASNGRLWVSSLCAINEYNAGGECLRTIPGHSFMSYMESCENVLYFIAFLTGVLCAMDTTSGAIKVMANHVKSTGGMAVLPAAQKLLFISSRNSLCQLDLQSGECRVITPSVWPEGGRLLTGNDQLALLIVPCTGGNNFFSCSVQGELWHLRMQAARLSGGRKSGSIITSGSDAAASSGPPATASEIADLGTWELIDRSHTVLRPASAISLPMPPRRSGRVSVASRGEPTLAIGSPARFAPMAPAQPALPALPLVKPIANLNVATDASVQAADANEVVVVNDDDDDEDESLLVGLLNHPENAALQQRGGLAPATQDATISAIKSTYKFWEATLNDKKFPITGTNATPEQATNLRPAMLHPMAATPQLVTLHPMAATPRLVTLLPMLATLRPAMLNPMAATPQPATLPMAATPRLVTLLPMLAIPQPDMLHLMAATPRPAMLHLMAATPRPAMLQASRPAPFKAATLPPTAAILWLCLMATILQAATLPPVAAIMWRAILLPISATPPAAMSHPMAPSWCTMNYADTLCTLHAPILNCRGITADCDGYEVVCCVEEEGVGWVVKRSRVGAGFAMLFSVDFEPSGFVANGTSFWLSNDTSIMEYNAAGECLQSIPGPSKASYMEFFGDTLYFLAYDDKGRSALYALDEDSKAIMLLAHHVEPSGGFAIFPADQKLLFINTSNNLCELDLQSGECQGLRVSMGPEGGRLLTGNNELALLIPSWTMYSVNTLCTLHSPILNSRGITADCDGYAVVCCVEEEGVGWVVKRSQAGNRGPSAIGAGLDMLDNPVLIAHTLHLLLACSVDFKPSGFVANGTSFWIAHSKTIMEYNDTGECLQSIPGPAKASFMEILGDTYVIAMTLPVADLTLYFIAYNNKWCSALYALHEHSKTGKLLANHVETSGGFAIFPAAQTLLFTNTSNNLCKLDLQSGECRVLKVSSWLGGRLMSGDDQLALLLVPEDDGSSCYSCSAEGRLCQLMNVTHSAVNEDFCLNSRGDLLFFNRAGFQQDLQPFSPQPSWTMYSVYTLCTLHSPILNVRGITARCEGYAVVCCVEEEGSGWVVKRSRAGAGFAMLFSVDFEPTGFASNGTSFWVAYGNGIMKYNDKGYYMGTISELANVSYMECTGNTLYFIADNKHGQSALYVCYEDFDEDASEDANDNANEGANEDANEDANKDANKDYIDFKLLANHVKPSGGLAIFPDDQTLLFVSTGNKLCKLDMSSGECQVFAETAWPVNGRLLTGNNREALVLVDACGGLDLFRSGESHIYEMADAAKTISLSAVLSACPKISI
ncbi:hypothetical protein QJQ45_016335, partial [Haematococcus lacustris]